MRVSDHCVTRICLCRWYTVELGTISRHAWTEWLIKAEVLPLAHIMYHVCVPVMPANGKTHL